MISVIKTEKINDTVVKVHLNLEPTTIDRNLERKIEDLFNVKVLPDSLIPYDNGHTITAFVKAKDDKESKKVATENLVLCSGNIFTDKEDNSIWVMQKLDNIAIIARNIADDIKFMLEQKKKNIKHGLTEVTASFGQVVAYYDAEGMTFREGLVILAGDNAHVVDLEGVRRTIKHSQIVASTPMDIETGDVAKIIDFYKLYYAGENEQSFYERLRSLIHRLKKL